MYTYIFFWSVQFILRKNLHHISPPTEFLQEMCNEKYVFCFNFFSSFKLFHLSGKYGTHQALSSWKVYMLAHFPFPNLYLYLSKYLSNFARPPHRPRGYLYSYNVGSFLKTNIPVHILGQYVWSLHILIPFIVFSSHCAKIDMPGYS